MPFFTPPVVYDQPPFSTETSRGDFLYARRRPPQPRGRSVVKIAGVYSVVDGPSMALQNTAEVTYLGGHIYWVTDNEAADLVAAGFTVTPDVYTLFPLETLYPDDSLYPGYQVVYS